jgi:hypothetical protein
MTDFPITTVSDVPIDDLPTVTTLIWRRFRFPCNANIQMLDTNTAIGVDYINNRIFTIDLDTNAQTTIVRVNRQLHSDNYVSAFCRRLNVVVLPDDETNASLIVISLTTGDVVRTIRIDGATQLSRGRPSLDGSLLVLVDIVKKIDVYYDQRFCVVNVSDGSFTFSDSMFCPTSDVAWAPDNTLYFEQGGCFFAWVPFGGSMRMLDARPPSSVLLPVEHFPCVLNGTAWFQFHNGDAYMRGGISDVAVCRPIDVRFAWLAAVLVREE